VNDDKIALFDMDGSLADFDGALRSILEEMRAPSEPPIPDNLWDMEREPYIKARMRAIKAVPGFWLNLEPIRMGFEVYYLAKSIGFTNEILTKGPKSHALAWAEKLQWVQKYFGTNVDVHIVSDNAEGNPSSGKGRVYGRVLYDDYPDYMLKWLKHRPRGLGIMPVTPANRDFTHPQVLRYNGLNGLEVEQVLLAAYNRKSMENVTYESESR
jgi:5'-nucleotidase